MNGAERLKISEKFEGCKVRVYRCDGNKDGWQRKIYGGLWCWGKLNLFYSSFNFLCLLLMKDINMIDVLDGFLHECFAEKELSAN